MQVRRPSWLVMDDAPTPEEHHDEQRNMEVLQLIKPDNIYNSRIFVNTIFKCVNRYWTVIVFSGNTQIQYS